MGWHAIKTNHVIIKWYSTSFIFYWVFYKRHVQKVLIGDSSPIYQDKKKKKKKKRKKPEAVFIERKMNDKWNINFLWNSPFDSQYTDNITYTIKNRYYLVLFIFNLYSIETH